MEMMERHVKDVDRCPVTVKPTSLFPVRFQNVLSRNERAERKETKKGGAEAAEDL